MSDIPFESIDWNQLGNPDYLLRIGVDPTQITSPPAPAPGPTTVGGIVQNNLSGRAVVQAILRDAGLDITPELDQYISNLASSYGNDIARLGAVVNADLYDTGSTLGKVVDQKFPEIAQRVKNGYAPISVGDAITYRNTSNQYARAEGLPPNLLDPSKLIANNVSLVEVQSRLHNFYRAVEDSAPDVVAQLHDYYGYSRAQIAALAVDPDQTEAHLVRQFESAQVGAAGTRASFGPVTTAEAEQLAAQGVTGDAAAQGFGQLAAQRGLFTALPGQGEDDITRQEQLGAVFSNSQAAAERIRRRRERRLAEFGGGGGLNVVKGGVGGLGNATT